MLSVIIRRMLALMPVLMLVAAFAFLVLRMVPGDPAAIIAGETATTEQVAEIRQRLGLDQPLAKQFVIWLGHVVRGDFGESYFFKLPVMELVRQRIEPTLALGACALMISIVVAVPLGVLAAFRQGSRIDDMVMGLSVLGFSVPGFVLGYALMYVFAIELDWLPVQGYTRIADGLAPFFARIILPASALAVVYIALIARITRTSVLEVLNEDYIRTARAKGLTEAEVLVRHALRNAAVPILTIIGIGIGLLIGGAVVTESVFAIPGLGRLTVEAVLSRDFPVIQALIVLFSVAYVMVNLLVDIGYAFLDPRIRY